MSGFQTNSFQSNAIQTGGAAATGEPLARVTWIEFEVPAAASGAVTKEYTGTGGAVTSGTAPVARVRVPPVVGGIVTSGAAPVARIRVPPATGGAVTDGTAVTLRTALFTYVASGLAETSGSALAVKVKVFTATGGADIYGTAPVLTDRAYVGIGGATSAGSAPVSRTRALSAYGEVVTSGAAALARTWAYSGSGGAVTSGDATTFIVSPGTFVWVPSGGAVTDGTAPLVVVKTPAGSGGAVTGGSASTSLEAAGSYTYWRLNLTSPGYCAIREIEMRATVGGADQCSGGTPSASSVWASQTASLAFDDSTSTYWESGVAGGSHWIQYQFASAVAVDEIVITQGYTNTERVESFVVKASNNGSSWVTIHTGFSCDDFADFQVQRYWLSGTKTYWRLNVSDTNTPGATYINVAEFDMRLSIGGADQCSGGNSKASSVFSAGFEAFRAFDNNASTEWSGARPGWLWYHFDDNKEVVEYFIQATATSGWLIYTPRVWGLEYSGDGINWTVASSRSNETGWTVGETRTYSVGAATYTYAGSGGAVTSGAAPLVVVKTLAGVGGIVTGGSASASFTPAVAYVGSGGITTGGFATVSRDRVLTGVGGAVASGTAPVARVRAYVSSGGAATGGSAVTRFGTTSEYAGSGGIVTGGSAPTLFARFYAYVGSGGVVTGGTTLVSRAYAYVGSGGVVTGGTAGVHSQGVTGFPLDPCRVATVLAEPRVALVLEEFRAAEVLAETRVAVVAFESRTAVVPSCS